MNFHSVQIVFSIKKNGHQLESNRMCCQRKSSFSTFSRWISKLKKKMHTFSLLHTRIWHNISIQIFFTYQNINKATIIPSTIHDALIICINKSVSKMTFAIWTSAIRGPWSMMYICKIDLTLNLDPYTVSRLYFRPKFRAKIAVDFDLYANFDLPI